MADIGEEKRFGFIQFGHHFQTACARLRSRSHWPGPLCNLIGYQLDEAHILAVQPSEGIKCNDHHRGRRLVALQHHAGMAIARCL